MIITAMYKHGVAQTAEHREQLHSGSTEAVRGLFSFTALHASVYLNRGYMWNLLRAICCRGAKITVQLF